jgi:PEP-CTERM motif
MKHKQTLALAAMAFILAARPATAAILWAAPTTISGDNDVLTNGILFAAYGFGGSQETANTVAGVDFEPWVVGNVPFTETVGDITIAAPDSIDAANILFGSTTGSFTSLSSSYQSLLSGAAYAQPTGGMTVTISGLTVGDNYEIEFWVNDSRGGIGPSRTETLNGGGSPSASIHFDTGAQGGLGQFDVGTFTATAGTQQFSLMGNAVDQVNALEIRDTGVGFTTPEPSSAALLGLGALALGFGLRRKRKA